MATAIRISPRGTLTLPADLRRRLKLGKHSVLVVENRADGIFLRPSLAVKPRDIPAATIRKWVAKDEADAASVKMRDVRFRGRSRRDDS